MAMKVETYGDVKNKNPVVHMRINASVVELSVMEAKQLAINLLATAERARYHSNLDGCLRASLGSERAEDVMRFVEMSAREDE